MRILVLSILLSFSMAPAAYAKRVYGAAIPDEVAKVSEARFRSKRDWDRTLRFFRSVYRRTSGVVWQRIETPPNIKGVHIANTRAKRKWDGINIYETKKGRVFIYVLKAKP